jgi:tetratricopeptide (TPR) repeat protein
MKKRFLVYGLASLCMVFGLNRFSYSQSQDEINQVKAFWKAERASREKKYDQAIIYYQQVTAYKLNNDIERESATSIAGITMTTDENKALTLYLQMIKLYPNTIEELIALSRVDKIYHKQNKPFDLNMEYKQRVERLEKQAQTTSNREQAAKSLMQIGRIYSVMHEKDKANQIFQEVINKYSGTTSAIGAYVSVAFYNCDTPHQNYYKAIDLLNVVENEYKNFPGAVIARLTLASMLLDNLNKDKEALAIVNDVKKNLPYDRYTPRTYFFLAHYYTSKKDYAKAIEYNQELIKKYPETINALNAERAIPVLQEQWKGRK